MDKYDKIKSIDDTYFEQYQIIMDNLTSLVKNVKTSKSIMNLVSLNMYINFLKTGMFDLYESDNIISMNVLFRSIFDYFLRFQYLFLRLIEEKNDNAVTEYLSDSNKHDIFGYINALKFIKQKLNPSLLTHFQIPEIKTKIDDKYSYKKMIEFIVKKTNLNNGKEDNLDFLTKMLLKYSELSKYVHGGIYDLEYNNQQKRQDEMLLILDITCKNAIACLHQIVLVLFQEHREKNILTETYNKLDFLLKENINTA
jgi:hypothetical protein